MCIITHNRNPESTLCISDCCLLREASCEGDAIPICKSSHLAGGSSRIPGVLDCLEAVFANCNLPDDVPHVYSVLCLLYLMLYVALLHLLSKIFCWWIFRIQIVT